MLRKVSVLITAAAILACGSARAQDAGSASGAGPGVVEVTVIPAGAAFFSSKNSAPSFGNYGLGTAVTYNINRVIGVEGEFGAMISTTSDLQFGDLNHRTKAPNFMSYNVNAIVTAASVGAARVYAAGGIGGLTMFERAGLGVTGDTTFLAGNVGGGVKWYAGNSRWGLRGDYRLVVNRSSDTAPSFFGTESRYGHRLYAGVIVNAAR
jgi:hypothetical protein